MVGLYEAEHGLSTGIKGGQKRREPLTPQTAKIERLEIRYVRWQQNL